MAKKKKKDAKKKDAKKGKKGKPGKALVAAPNTATTVGPGPATATVAFEGGDVEPVSPAEDVPPADADESPAEPGE
jgi:hypothetical protein